MSDGTTLNAGAGGDTLATDDIASVKYQRVKITVGADGVNDGDVASGNPLPVILMPNSGVDSGDVTVNNGTGASSVPVQGAAAIDAASAGNPVYIGGRASAAAPSDVSADNDAQAVWLTLKGAVNVADAGGTLSIDDGGGAITVDGTVAVADGGGSLTVDGTVAISSQVPGTGATNLGKAVDSAAGATDTGVAMLAVRDDSLSALTPAEGDYVNLRVDSTGALYVTGGGGGTEYVVNAAAPADPTGATFVMERDDQLAALGEVEGDWTNPRATSKGALWVAIADSAGDPITSFGGGTQYTEGDTDATITGTAMLMEGAGNALVVVQGTTADGLLVNLGANNDVVVTNAGTFAVQVDGADTLANGQVVPTTTAATLVASRATRTRLILQNIGACTVYVGIATVTTANGFPIPPGATLDLHTTALVQGIIATGSTGANIAYIEEYF